MKHILFLLFSFSSISMAIDEPSYTVIKKEGDIEVRSYAPYLIAEIRIPSTDMNEASNAGFKKLFQYISGNNRSKAGIEMTAPVTTQRSESIAMTAPVTTMRDSAGYRIGFVLPLNYTLATAPVPNDPAIVIREVPSRTAAVIRFSGRWTDSNMDEHTQELFRWLSAQQYTPVSTPVIARFDPPFMPWFLRRNEIQIEIAP